MMEDPKLDEEIINYYSDQRLSTTRLEMLLEDTLAAKNAAKNQNAGAHDRRSARHSATLDPGTPDAVKVWFPARCLEFACNQIARVHHPRRMTLASFCLLAGFVWFSGANLFDAGATHGNDLSNIMLREAALNHQTKLQVEYDDADLAVLAKSMERLEFELKVPSRLADSHTLLGGRYCTLAGNLAVHLRLQPTASTPTRTLAGNNPGIDSGDLRSVDEERSVFVTLATKELAALGDLSHVFPDKVAVNSWQQGELFYLVAEGGQR